MNNEMTAAEGNKRSLSECARSLSVKYGLAARTVTSIFLSAALLVANACGKEEEAETTPKKEIQVLEPVDFLAQDNGNWKFMYADDADDLRTYFYYNGSILSVNPQGNPTLWQKYIEVSAADKAVKADRKMLPYKLQKIEVSCSEEKFRVIEVRSYGPDSLLTGADKTVPQAWEAVIPDTLTNWWFVIGCNSQAKKDYDGMKIVREVADFFSKKKE